MLRDICMCERWDSLCKDLKPSKQTRASLSAIFVEMKLRFLSLKDSQKYLAFVRKIRGLPNFRFVLITSRARAELEQLRNEKSEKSWEKSWYNILNHPEVKVVTYGEVLEALQDPTKTGEPLPSLFATAFARDYFTILVHPKDVDDHWRYCCKLADLGDNRDVVFLRDWIVDTAIDIALGTGYITRYPNLPSDEKRPSDEKNNWLQFSGSAHEVEFTRRSGKGKTTDLRISVDDVKIHFDLQAVQPLEITEKLGRLKQTVSPS